MVLSRSISWHGRAWPMVGAIPGDAVMQPRPVGRGYVRLRETAAMPWPGGDDASIQGHEFHHSSLENIDPGVSFAYEVERGHGIDGRHDGLCVQNVLASYTHRRSAADGWAARFVDFVRQHAAVRPVPAGALAA
jgi:cobyrinic acid a,c-diamide synthase